MFYRPLELVLQNVASNFLLPRPHNTLNPASMRRLTAVSPTESTLILLLRQCYTTPYCRGAVAQLSQRRTFTVSTNQHASGDSHSAKRVAVIGGGITGLSTAFYLRSLPLDGFKPQVTIFESSNRLGGWMKSERIDTG